MITITAPEGDQITGPSVAAILEENWQPGAYLGEADEQGHRPILVKDGTNRFARHNFGLVSAVDGVDEDPQSVLVADLHRAADRAMNAEKALIDGRAARDELIVRAAAHGVPKVAIAAAADISRVMVDKILEREAGE